MKQKSTIRVATKVVSRRGLLEPVVQSHFFEPQVCVSKFPEELLFLKYRNDEMPL